ncbi:MAG: DUF2721 domain-containing protein [Pseudomonadales bacterium]|nr:DUF2721 domain-containing protein [Pseudomonadales bacterium]
MEHNASIDAIAQVIQLAVAPVFLLTGIAGILAVLSTRLGRITDRARLLERRMSQLEGDAERMLLHRETNLLWRRIRMVNWAIRLSVGAALLICLVVMTLFVGDYAVFDYAVFDPGLAIAILFVCAMVLMVLGLLLLLLEVSISTRNMRQGLEHLLEESRRS